METFENDMTSFRRRDDVLTVLIHLGYLAYDRGTDALCIPNDKSPQSAIEQIRERRYPEALEAYQGNVLLVGISYDKESKEHSCVIEEWDLQ